jgi:uncharacterized SAM-binding protein YcdF (DUF218 family)
MFKYRVIGLVLIMSGIVDFIYYILIHSRGITFSTFFFATSIALVGAGIIGYIAEESNILKKLLLMLKPIKFIFFLIMLSFLIIEATIIYWGTIRQLTKTDYIIIFGAGVRGTIPSLTLYERLKAGLKCIYNNPEALIILSGGKGPGEDISEAEAMKRFLMERGVNEKRLVLEDKSRDTRQNILFSKDKIKEMRGNENVSVMLVTSNFHMFRAGFLARRAGIKGFYYSAPILPWLVPTYYIREYFAVLKSFFFDKL